MDLILNWILCIICAATEKFKFFLNIQWTPLIGNVLIDFKLSFNDFFLLLDEILLMLTVVYHFGWEYSQGMLL